MAFLSKYGVARHIYIAIPKAGSANHAVGADWTPAAGDVKISKDGGAAANVTNLPTAIAMGNSALWDFSLTATELQAAQVVVTVADSATKAVDDTGFEVETYGHASAQHEFDLDEDHTPQTGDAYAIVNSGTFGNSALKTLIDAVDNFVDTEIADIQSRLPAALTSDGNMKADTLRVGGTLQTAGDIIGDTNDIQARIPRINRENTAQGGSFTTITLDAGASSTNDLYVGNWILLTGGTGSGQIAYITAYNGTTKVATVHAPGWGVAPDATTTFRILEYAQPAVILTTGGNMSAATAVWASAARSLTVLDEDSTTLDLDATIRSAVGLASANLDTQLTAIDDYIDTEIAAIQTTLAALFTTALTEAYRTDGSTGTVAQLLYEILSHHAEVSISSTTKTTKKLDGSTTATTLTLNSATTPTAVTRSG